MKKLFEIIQRETYFDFVAVEVKEFDIQIFDYFRSLGFHYIENVRRIETEQSEVSLKDEKLNFHDNWCGARFILFKRKRISKFRYQAASDVILAPRDAFDQEILKLLRRLTMEDIVFTIDVLFDRVGVDCVWLQFLNASEVLNIQDDLSQRKPLIIDIHSDDQELQKYEKGFVENSTQPENYDELLHKAIEEKFLKLQLPEDKKEQLVKLYLSKKAAFATLQAQCTVSKIAPIHVELVPNHPEINQKARR